MLSMMVKPNLPQIFSIQPTCLIPTNLAHLKSNYFPRIDFRAMVSKLISAFIYFCSHVFVKTNLLD